MNVGEVYTLRCVGQVMLVVVIRVHKSRFGFVSMFEFVNLEDGVEGAWYAEPKFGDKVGEWRPFGEDATASGASTIDAC